MRGLRTKWLADLFLEMSTFFTVSHRWVLLPSSLSLSHSVFFVSMNKLSLTFSYLVDENKKRRGNVKINCRSNVRSSIGTFRYEQRWSSLAWKV